MDIDGDGNCAIHESPGVYRPAYKFCLNDAQAWRYWAAFNRIRNRTNAGRIAVKAIMDDAYGYEGLAQKLLREAFNMAPFNLEVDPIQKTYTLDQLWPHDGFVKPIYELATPHLRNIVAQFSDDKLFYVSSKGKTRHPDESSQLRKRVDLCRKVLQEREAKLIGQTRENLQRRIRDTKMRMAQIADRRFQQFNEPDYDELHNMNKHALALIVDLQMELGL